MAITDRDVVDSVAYEDSILLLQLYDHLDFEGEFEKDHMLMLQDKLIHIYGILIVNNIKQHILVRISKNFM